MPGRGSTLAKVKKAIGEQQTSIQSLGLVPEAGRVVRWIDRYGAGLGLTEAGNATVDQLAVAVDGWHKTYGDLAVAVLFHTKDSAKAGDIRAKLLGPYERAAEQERAEARKHRAKAKSSEA